MKATRLLHDLGQSIWLDNITRDLLDSGTLKRYINELSVTGLTSNPTIFNQAIKNSPSYDAAIRAGLEQGKSSEGIFFDLALEDLTRAANLSGRTGIGPIAPTDGSRSRYRRSSPTTPRARCGGEGSFGRARRPNVYIKIPGTVEGLPAIEEAIFAGVPVNVTLLFSREHYVAAADAYLRAIERRIDAGLDP